MAVLSNAVASRSDLSESAGRTALHSIEKSAPSAALPQIQVARAQLSVRLAHIFFTATGLSADSAEHAGIGVDPFRGLNVPRLVSLYTKLLECYSVEAADAFGDLVKKLPRLTVPGLLYGLSRFEQQARNGGSYNGWSAARVSAEKCEAFELSLVAESSLTRAQKKQDRLLSNMIRSEFLKKSRAEIFAMPKIKSGPTGDVADSQQLSGEESPAKLVLAQQLGECFQYLEIDLSVLPPTAKAIQGKEIAQIIASCLGVLETPARSRTFDAPRLKLAQVLGELRDMLLPTEAKAETQQATEAEEAEDLADEKSHSSKTILERKTPAIVKSRYQKEMDWSNRVFAAALTVPGAGVIIPEKVVVGGKERSIRTSIVADALLQYYDFVIVDRMDSKFSVLLEPQRMAEFKKNNPKPKNRSALAILGVKVEKAILENAKA